MVLGPWASQKWASESYRRGQHYCSRGIGDDTYNEVHGGAGVEQNRGTDQRARDMIAMGGRGGKGDEREGNGVMMMWWRSMLVMVVWPRLAAATWRREPRMTIISSASFSPEAKRIIPSDRIRLML